LALSILAYKGFTFFNQGEILKIHIKMLAFYYYFNHQSARILCNLALSVAGGLSIEEIVVLKDYALAAAAKPVFGEWGSILTIFLAIIATVSGVIASVYSASRMLGCQMKQVPNK
jgi:amino acid transporter